MVYVKMVNCCAVKGIWRLNTLEQVEMGQRIVEYYIMVNYRSFVLFYTKEMLWIRYSTSIFFSRFT